MCTENLVFVISIFLPVSMNAVEESVEWKRRLVCTGTTAMANQLLRNPVKIRIFSAKRHS